MTTAVVMAATATAVAAIFAIQLGRQFASRRRHHALAWAISLSLFAVGAATVAVGLVIGWSSPLFVVYWVSGALLTVPYLAAGQLLLLDPKRAPLYWTLVGLATVWAFAAVAMSAIDSATLSSASVSGNIPLGEGVWGDGLAFQLLGWFNYTAIIVVVGVVWSAVQSRRWLILLIAVGVVIAGASFAFVRAELPAAFTATLAVGVATMYGGFRAAMKPAKRAASRASSRDR